MTMKWYGPQVKASVDKITMQRIRRACIAFRDFIRIKLSTPVTKLKGGGRRRIVGRSSPGDWPRKDRGHLRRNVQYEVDVAEKSGRVGTNVKYGKYLELGTKRMKRRPWMTRAVAAFQLRIKNILTGKA